MFKSKKFKIILIIFAVITAVGVTAGLLGSLSSSDDGPVIKDSHEHEFEVISSEPGTCTTPGTETVRCKTCFLKETREVAGEHNYSEFDVCKDCGYSEVHTKLTSTITTNPDDDTYSLGSFSSYNECVFLVLFNQGLDEEYGYYVYYDGTEYFTSDSFEGEVNIVIENDEIRLVSGSVDHFSSSPTVTVYSANPNGKYLKIGGITSEMFDLFEISVDGEPVDRYGDFPLVLVKDSVTVQYSDSITDLEENFGGYLQIWEVDISGDVNITHFVGQVEESNDYTVTFKPSCYLFVIQSMNV